MGWETSAEPGKSRSALLQIGGWRVEASRRRIMRAGNAVSLRPKEMDVLTLLAEKCLAGDQPTVVSIDELISEVWSGSAPNINTIQSVVSRLRKALGCDSRTPKFIKTLGGRGYQLVATVTELEPARSSSMDDAAPTPVAASSATPSTNPAASDASRATNVDPKTLFVGRQPAMAGLMGALFDIAAGQGRTILLAGELGNGKTFTVKEYSRVAKLGGARVFSSGCQETGMTLPYWPWIALLRELIADRSPAWVREHLDSDAGGLFRILPELQDFWGGAAVPRDQDHRTVVADVSHALTTLLRAIAAETPVVVVVDDLHRADVPTLGVLQCLSRDLAHCGVLIVGVYQDTEIELSDSFMEALVEIRRQPGTERIELPAFTFAEIRELVDRLGGIRASDDFIEEINRKTGGNGLLVSEFALEVAARSMVDPQTLARLLGPMEMFVGRLGQLSETCRRVLEIASVGGFDCVQVARVGGFDESEVADAMQEAQVAWIIEVGPQTHMQFKHVLIREKIYNELDRGRRDDLHRAFADALEASVRVDRYAMFATAIAHHRAAAGDRLEAASWLKRAGRALAETAPDEACKYYRAGFAQLDEYAIPSPLLASEVAALSCELAESYLKTCQTAQLSEESVYDVLSRGLAVLGCTPLGEPPTDPNDALRAVDLYIAYADVVGTRGNVGAALRFARHATTAAHRSGDTGQNLKAALALTMWLGVTGGRHDTTCTIGVRCIAEASPIVLEASSSQLTAAGASFIRLLAVNAKHRAWMGEPLEAVAQVKRALKMLHKDGASVDPEDVSIGSHGHGEFRGDPDDCIEAAWWGYCLLGEATRAERCARHYCSGKRAGSEAIEEARCMIGHAQRLRLDWAGLADTAVQLNGSRNAESVSQHRLSRAWLAEARAHLGDGEGVAEAVVAVLFEPEQATELEVLLSCASTLILCDSAGRTDGIDAVIERMEAMVTASGAYGFLPYVHELRARLALMCGDEVECALERRTAERLWARMGASRQIRRMMKELAELRGMADDSSELIYNVGASAV